MRITNQMAAVMCTGIVGLTGMVWFLAAAGWSEGGITGMVTGIGTVVGSLIVITRNQAKAAETLAGQDDKLDQVVRQTNGKSDAERDDIARRASEQAVRVLLDKLRQDGLLPPE